MPKTSKNLQDWVDMGNSLPTCINIGCSNPVMIRHWSTSNGSLLPSLKTECSRCSTARKKGKSLCGIQIVKKNYCENCDGQLGFVCPMNPLRYSEFPMDCYHMDHKDGNHENNIPANIITLCSICHARKGKESGDFNSLKKTSRKLRKQADPSLESYSDKTQEETVLASSITNVSNHPQKEEEFVEEHLE